MTARQFGGFLSFAVNARLIIRNDGLFLSISFFVNYQYSFVISFQQSYNLLFQKVKFATKIIKIII